LARSYFKSDGKLNYDSYVDALKKGRSYVSDGSSHIIDFSVNGVEPGLNDSKVELKNNQSVKISARVVASLPEKQTDSGAAIAKYPFHQKPYWHLERARVGTTQNVRVELIVNGEAVASKEIVADGKWKDVAFDYNVNRSSWVAIRIFASSHTNPVFVYVGGKPIREKKSAEWCRKAVDQCWKMKQNNIRQEERREAQAAYDKARAVYDAMIKESH
jgi:hypothetical protein